MGTCPTCQGSGTVSSFLGTTTCKVCKGSGSYGGGGSPGGWFSGSDPNKSGGGGSGLCLVLLGSMICVATGVAVAIWRLRH